MDSLSYKTISANASTVTKEWVVIDAADEVLGRLASQIAKILRGKNKPSYTPHVDCGDYVIVINADKVKLTGKKMTDKVYTRHTVYVKPGKGQITINRKALEVYFPLEILQYQVKQPLLATNTVENYDIVINLDGGGITGQASAARLGIARALCEIDAEMRPALKKAGFLTRDPREVERKKPGQPGARRKFQFSKR